MNAKNPFYVLELAPDAAPADIERQGRKILGLLEVGSTKAKSYACPLGTFERDETMVREAMSALRDPKRRAREAALAAVLRSTAPPSTPPRFDAPLADAFELGGYRGL